MASGKYKFTHNVFNDMLLNVIHSCVFEPSLLSFRQYSASVVGINSSRYKSSD
jgi:hypothetical protein